MRLLPRPREGAGGVGAAPSIAGTPGKVPEIGGEPQGRGPLEVPAPPRYIAAFRAGGRPVKPDIHPDYHEITVVMTDGSTFTTRSTYGKEGDTLHLDVDPKSHPAWTGGNVQVIERGQVEKFNRRFQSFRRKK